MRTVLALAILLAAAPARAGNNELTIGTYNRALRSSSANALTGDSLFGSEVGYARRFLELPRLVLWAHVAMTIGTAEGELFRTVDTHVESVGFALGGRARYQLHRNVAVHARVDAGTANVSLRLRDSMGHSARDHHWGAVSSVALGTDLFAYASRRFSFGLRFELGYVAASAVELEAVPEGGNDTELALAMSRASLGRLDLGGRFFALSMIGQF